MTMNWTLTDVPAVPAQHMRLAMKILVDNGRGLALLNGLSKYDRDRLEDKFWASFQGSRSEGRAVLVRLDELVRVFACQRLKDVFLRNGYPVMLNAAQIAATMRLNAEWGFNPQKFLWTLKQLDLSHRPSFHLQAAA